MRMSGKRLLRAAGRPANPSPLLHPVNFTLNEVGVVGLMGRKDRGHLVVVGGVDVLINAVAGQLYLQNRSQSKRERKGRCLSVTTIDRHARLGRSPTGSVALRQHSSTSIGRVGRTGGLLEQPAFQGTSGPGLPSLPAAFIRHWSQPGRGSSEWRTWMYFALVMQPVCMLLSGVGPDSV